LFTAGIDALLESVRALVPASGTLEISAGRCAGYVVAGSTPGTGCAAMLEQVRYHLSIYLSIYLLLL